MTMFVKFEKKNSIIYSIIAHQSIQTFYEYIVRIVQYFNILFFILLTHCNKCLLHLGISYDDDISFQC